MANNVRYRSGDWTLAAPVGAIRDESPLLPFSNEQLVFHQDFVQKRLNFVPLDYNSISPDIPGFKPAYLIDESERQDYGGNSIKWTRSWARIPDSYDMPGGVYLYQFPGFDTGRIPIVLPVALTIHRDFFLCGNNGAFAQWQDIPINRGFFVYEDGDITQKTDTVSDTSTPTQSDYETMINNGTPIQIEDSKITPWRGSIFVREDYFVIAK